MIVTSSLSLEEVFIQTLNIIKERKQGGKHLNLSKPLRISVDSTGKGAFEYRSFYQLPAIDNSCCVVAHGFSNKEGAAKHLLGDIVAFQQKKIGKNDNYKERLFVESMASKSPFEHSILIGRSNGALLTPCRRSEFYDQISVFLKNESGKNTIIAKVPVRDNTSYANSNNDRPCTFLGTYAYIPGTPLLVAKCILDVLSEVFAN